MDLRNRTSIAIVKWALRVTWRICGVHVEAKGLENVPDDRAVLFVANHRSNFDTVATYPLMKRPTGYIAKKEMKKIPFLSWWMYFANCIFLDRDNPREGLKSILKASEYVKRQGGRAYFR